ncbi:hypothetical protein [Halalkalicoccus sp. NIPERK01]|uniref:hypothetical protein n=1 Tax=Halalkalicoccus sp. NIPERK01 TaxID=3053469 RepID=UPI00256EC1E9|nr:hypothetical protein [Halalkalicoccus sp. NIPERK01]MDL5362726.1 hypothetical protein [Halalkalicoccus sp. NIPERK01]
MNTQTLNPTLAAQFGTPTDAEGYDIDADAFGEADERELARFMAERTCLGFIYHDRREYEAAVEAFYHVDRHQFAHLTDEEAREAARALTDAFWAKDDVEQDHIDGADVDPALDDADWSPVEEALSRRAEIVGMDDEYAPKTTEAWRNHKTGGDYWTPTMAAQRHEIAAAIGDYEEKPKYGRSGYGHLTARYLVGLELHDMHTERHWKEAAGVMADYYREILGAQEADR